MFTEVILPGLTGNIAVLSSFGGVAVSISQYAISQITRLKSYDSYANDPVILHRGLAFLMPHRRSIYEMRYYVVGRDVIIYHL
jgi:hypothetical protein